MLKKLTKEQEKIMLETRDKWINLFFDNVKEKRGINKHQFEDGVKWLYCDLLKKPMPTVIYCDSWESCLLTMRRLKKKSKVGASISNLVKDLVWDLISDLVWFSVKNSVSNLVWDSVSNSVSNLVWSPVWDSVNDLVKDSVNALVNNYSTYIALCNYSWVSFYDFFDKIGIINNDNFKECKKLLQSGVFNAYEYENYIFAIQPPTYIERNTQGKLHSTTKKAVEFRDGSGYFFINGRSIPERIFTDTITKETFLKETNSDIKGAMYEILGQKGMLSLLGAEIVDTKNITHKNGDVETIKLLKTSETFKEIDNQPFAWVSMTCPSTGTNYLQGVEPHYTDAIKAIASLSPLSVDEYSFNFRS